MNAPVYVDIDQGIHKVKLKVALNEKRKKLHGFSFSINIANFEAFRWTKKLISNLFFLKSVKVSVSSFKSSSRCNNTFPASASDTSDKMPKKVQFGLKFHR